MLTTQELSQYAQQLLDLSDDVLCDEVTEVIIAIERIFYQSINALGEQEKQLLLKIEKDFLQPYVSESDSDDDDDDDDDASESEAQREENISAHIVLCYSRIALLKLLLGRENKKEDPFVNLPNNAFYTMIIKMFVKFTSKYFNFSVYLNELIKRQRALEKNNTFFDFVVLYDTGIISIVATSPEPSEVAHKEITNILDLKFLFVDLIKRRNNVNRFYNVTLQAFLQATPPLLNVEQIDQLAQGLFWSPDALISLDPPKQPLRNDPPTIIAKKLLERNKFINAKNKQDKNDEEIAIVIDIEFKKYLATLPLLERTAIETFDRRFLRNYSTNLPFLTLLENKLDTYFILSCARVALMKFIIAKNNQQAGCFQPISHLLFYGVMVNLFDKQYRDIVFDLCSYWKLINTCLDSIQYTKSQLLDLEIMILNDMDLISKKSTMNIDNEQPAEEPKIQNGSILNLNYLFTSYSERNREQSAVKNSTSSNELSDNQEQLIVRNQKSSSSSSSSSSKPSASENESKSSNFKFRN
jgi:hypothetical protein